MCAVLGKVQPWVWETWSSQEDSLEGCPEPQQVWLGLAWTSSQGAPGKVSCRPFGVESLSEQKSFLYRAREQPSRQLPRAQKKWRQWPLGLPLREEATFAAWGGFPCVKMGMHTGERRRHFEKAYRFAHS